MSFQNVPLWVNLAIFAAAAAAVWFAGIRLAALADAIAERTHLSRAFLGLILLGVATSLPELATTISGALIGNARLVAGNLFGGVAMQVAVLAIVDLIAVRGALTFFSPRPVLFFQGTMLLLLLSVALAGAALNEPLSLLGVGPTPVLLAGGYGLTAWVTYRGAVPRWQALEPPDETEAAESDDRWRRAGDGRLYGTSAGLRRDHPRRRALLTGSPAPVARGQ